MSKEKLIPELRFPEFKNEGEWEEDMVYNLVFTITPPKKITSSNYQKYGKFPIIDQSKNYYCGWTNDNEAVITEDLPLIIFGDHTCVIKIAKKPFAQGADGIKILKTKDKIFPEYLFHYLCHNEVVMEDYKRHYSILKDKVIVFPNINSGEQQRIASCLSSLDEVIEAHSKKLELLKDHKKGLMQNLFPQDGEKVPKLRFKEFENSGEWEEKKISDLGETISGLTGKSKDDFGAGKPFVTYKQVFDNSEINFEQCERVQISDDENQTSLQQGDILFTTSSETPNEVGFASVLIDFPKEKTYLNSFCFALRPFNIEKTQPQFSRYLFHSPIYRRSVTAIAQGSTRYNISKGAFVEIQVPIPAPTEQQKIASCLSSLDEVIEAQAEKIEQLKLHKKGLMQGLFPKIND